MTFTLNFYNYSLDVRGKPLSQASHWAESSSLGGRTTFRTKNVPNSLIVDQLILQVCDFELMIYLIILHSETG